MRLIRHCHEVPPPMRGMVIALGNFDGVHRGHRAVIGAALDQARSMGRAVAVMTFDPHPRRHFRPDLPPFALSSLRQKVRLIGETGVDLLCVLRFGQALAGLKAEDFVDTVLVRDLGVSGVVVGDDYAFGKGRAGDVTLLRTLASSRGFSVTSVAPVCMPNGTICSSTAVREALSAGDVEGAAAFLGRPWELEGRVCRGQARGRVLGFPTANVDPGARTRPARGVYAVRAGLDHDGETRWYDGVANYGTRPTFGMTDDVLEVHLLDMNRDLYGQRLRVQLLGRIRPEQAFSGPDALKARIAADIDAARIILARGAVNHID
ncbi:bifunctional riboflavin kinase/FAD synthetase [Haematospirillum sp. H1815]|uniref:bifunctional riboflavin kinase/FAD synthetase n=1 Tax=Haematospirillum sp. H1815 TaxID=2723108 RepID=UPI00143B08A4|nr:bifunctional riboflavin kinase/FAD synthetase [Haematospirillum sp. H1815]NKD76881.1 bifunctional riboflavin kinase/FAD synthetase [Haematospirillum sp. H1815]